MTENITKEQLNKNIKNTTEFKFYLEPKKLLTTKSINEAIIKINMKDYDLADKMLTKFSIKIVSKKFNGENIISENFINSVITNLFCEIFIGFSSIYKIKFINGENCILSDIIILNKYLHHHEVEMNLCNINQIRNIIEHLELEISGEYVSIYTDFESKLKSAFISQEIFIDDKLNILNTSCGMGSMSFSKFLSILEYNNYKEGIHMLSDNEIDKINMVNNKQIKKTDILEEKEFLNGEIVNINGIDGYEFTNPNDGLTSIADDFNNIQILEKKIFDYGFDFFCCNQVFNVNIDCINYWKIKNKNTYSHNYKIHISSFFNTMSELNLLVPELVNMKDFKIKINYYYSSGTTENLLTDPVDLKLINDVIKINLDSKHLITYAKIAYLNLCIENECEQEPINSKIIILAKLYKWSDNYLRYLVWDKNYLVEPKLIDNVIN